MFAGLRANARAAAVTYSACEPTPCGYGSMPNTSSSRLEDRHAVAGLLDVPAG
jgi:hypothetical protein